MDAKKIEILREQLSGQYEGIVTSINRGRLATNEIQFENTEDEFDLATISHDRHLLCNLQENGFQRAKSIQAALRAIDAGQYGECGRCGEDIREERLLAIPWATMCITCQERNEVETAPARPGRVGVQEEMEAEA